MSQVHRFPLPLFALVVLCASCGTNHDPTPVAPAEPAEANLPVVPIAADEPILAWDDVELTLDVSTRDPGDLPKEIRITFRNRSSKRGCLTLPRPVVEDQSYDLSMPSLLVGMRETRTGGLSPAEPFYLDTRPRGASAGPREGVCLDAGAQTTRRYDLSAFCLIGHGIPPNPTVNFSACYHPGDEPRELRAYLVHDWRKFTRIESNPVDIRSSEIDSSILERLYKL